MLLKNGRQNRMAQAASIRSLPSRGHTSVLRLHGGEDFVTQGPISGWAMRLPKQLFVQWCRGPMVNRGLIAGVTAIDRNHSNLLMKGCDTPLLISRLEASRLRKSL